MCSTLEFGYTKEQHANTTSVRDTLYSVHVLVCSHACMHIHVSSQQYLQAGSRVTEIYLERWSCIGTSYAIKLFNLISNIQIVTHKVEIYLSGWKAYTFHNQWPHTIRIVSHFQFAYDTHTFGSYTSHNQYWILVLTIVLRGCVYHKFSWLNFNFCRWACWQKQKCTL